MGLRIYQTGDKTVIQLCGCCLCLLGETSLLGDSESTKHYREPRRRPYEAWGEITGRPILLRSGHHRLELSGVYEADGVWNIGADFGRGCQFLEGLGKLLNCWWITGNQERPYCGFRGTEVQIHDPTTRLPCGVIIYSLEILVRTFAICYENRTRLLLAFDRTVFRLGVTGKQRRLLF